MRDSLKALLTLAAVTVASTLLTLALLSHWGGEEVPVPTVAGLPLIDAIDRLDREGLTVAVTGFDYSPTVGREGVIDQTPLAGKSLRRGEGVSVTVSRGSRTVTIPPLAGLPLLEAGALLAAAQMKNPALLRMPSSAPEGTTLAQYPAPGAVVPREERATLLVSSGPEPRYLASPDFTGLPLLTVMERVKRLELRISEVVYIHDERVEQGTVLSQQPPVGKRMRAGSFLSLTVSDGGEAGAGGRFLYYTVPDGPAAVRVTLTQENDNGAKQIYDRVHRPGDTFSVLVSMAGETAVKIFLDNELADVRRFPVP
ncbi:MAG: PASTA domain-containing protein [Nitrospinae bacterium]|nr:PASTA domain-containing protein [Nitrospinota bacterium]